jgi:hypothetical protein
MHRLRLLLLAPFALVLALMPAPASAAPPETLHFIDAGTNTDPDFCGSGQQVNIEYDIVTNVWISPDGEDDLVRVTQSGTVTFTNPDNGLTVTRWVAGQVTDVVLGDVEGVHTVLETHVGMGSRLQTANGPVLLRDAGSITFAFTFDGEEFTGLQVVSVRGPHPDADSDFALSCEVLTNALGIG